jgi:hypothetical protein
MLQILTWRYLLLAKMSTLVGPILTFWVDLSQLNMLPNSRRVASDCVYAPACSLRRTTPPSHITRRAIPKMVFGTLSPGTKVIFNVTEYPLLTITTTATVLVPTDGVAHLIGNIGPSCLPSFSSKVLCKLLY